MAAADRLHLPRHAGDLLKGFQGIEDHLADGSVDPLIRHLVKLRASQMNQCAFCVDMHNREAQEDGETLNRLFHLVIWRETGYFSPAERAALAWTEALTKMDDPGKLGDLHAALTLHFSEVQIANLTGVIAMINVWNRLQIASHGGTHE